jgi:hypothetical protein
MALKRNPLIYEINTWLWLADLSERYGTQITLANVPAEVINEIAGWHFDAIWLMGVWERSPHGRKIALEHPDLQFEYQRALGDYKPEDIVGSPYAIHRYVVDSRLGGQAGLSAFRAQLKDHTIRLILDYVPNHVAVDHHWTIDCPSCLVHGTPDDLKNRSSYYFKVPEHGAIMAHGRDPYYPAWTDTAQVNAFSQEARTQSLATLMDIASQCDAVRCDMSMLMVNHVFARVWNHEAHDIPKTEFWEEVIPPVKKEHPGFVFMAEVYWGMEAELQALGFDYTYDKRLYDRLKKENVHTVRDHLLAASNYQRRLVRFIENHDEERALACFGLEKSMAAATLFATLPGARMLHEGQIEGRRIKLPVQLGRRPKENVIEELVNFYRSLTNELQQSPYHDGIFMMLAAHPILSDDRGHEALISYAWELDGNLRVVIVNFCDQSVKGRIMLPRTRFAGLSTWQFTDVLAGTDPVLYIGDDLLTSGIPVELPAYGRHIFAVTRGS